MKPLFRFLPLALLALLPLMSPAQTQRKALLEQFTGTWCVWCPYGADSVRAILTRNPNAVALAYHDRDPMAIIDGYTVMDSLAVTGFPTAAIDRVVWQTSNNPPTYALALSRSVWGTATSIRSNVAAPMALNLTGRFDTTTRTLYADIDVNVNTDITGVYYIHLVISEDSLNYTQKKTDGSTTWDIYPYYHMRVVRHMVTGASGELLSATGLVKNQYIQKSYSYTLPSTWDIRRCKVTAFVDRLWPITYGHRDVQQATQEAIWNNSAKFTFLPVELQSFSAHTAGDGVLLTWRTLREENNAGWRVERMSDREQWREIAFVSGAGTQSSVRSYEHLDRDLSSGRTYTYRLRQVDMDGTEHLSNTVTAAWSALPVDTRLHQNYPNPFNPSTDITVEIGTAGPATLEVFDAMGRSVRILHQGNLSGGVHTFMWTGLDNAGSAVPAGLYICRLTAGSTVQTMQMLMTK